MKTFSVQWIKILLAATLLPMLVGGAWFYHSQQQTLQAQIQKELLAIARLKANRIAAWRQDRLKVAAALQDQVFLLRSVARYLADSGKDNENDLRTRLRSLARQHDYDDILLVDPDGNNRWSLTGPLHHHSDYRAILATALRGRIPEFVDLLHTDAQVPTPHMAVLAPLFSGADKSQKPLGAFLLVSNASRFLYPLLEFRPTPGKSAETLLVRRDGDHVIFFNALRRQPEAALKLRLSLDRTDAPAVMAVLGRQGAVQGRDYRGTAVVAMILPIPDSPWFMVTKVDAAEAYADWRRQSVLSLTILFGLAALCGLAVLLLWRKEKKSCSQALASTRSMLSKDDKGKVPHAIEASRDDTDIARLQAALLAGEQKFRAIFEHMAPGCCLNELVYDSGKAVDYRILDVNPAYERLIGIGRDRAVGALASGLFDTAKPPNIEIYTGVDATGEPALFEAFFPPTKKHFLVTTSRVAPGRLCTLFSDITEQKRAAKERERLLSAIEQAGETVLITDPDGAIRYVNPAFEQVTGYARKDAIGQNPRILKSGQHDPAFYRNMWKTISGGRTWEGRMVNKRRDGTLYTEDATISPVCDDSGRILNYVAVKRDVTEHLKLQAQFQQAQKMESVGRLAGGVAHDYNNMLTVILGHADLALAGVDRDHPLHADLAEIHAAAERSSEITRQLLAFARKQTIAPGALDLNETVGGMLQMLRRLIGEDIDLLWKPGANCRPVWMDPSQIDQILANLCVNARDAIAGVGKIIIETEEEKFDEAHCAQHPGFVPGEFVRLAVSDDGCGMDEATLGKIFEPFFTTKKAGQGTGLGLATVYGIVKQNNGFINVYSEPGNGTTIMIYFAPHTGKAEELKKTPAADIPKGGGETIIVVEDETPIREMSRQILETLGYKALVAGTPGEALQLADIHAGHIALLLTDVVMPEMDGRELARQLQALYPQIKTLYMSGYTADVIARRGVLDDGVDFIQKPFSVQDLAAKVKAVLDA